MLILGILLALLCGVANSGAALLQRREMMVEDTSQHSGLRLLARLAARPAWLLAMLLSAVGWGAETAALGLAPVAVVTTLRSAGRGGLVVAGHRWLGERFGRMELASVAMLAVGGILTAFSAATGHAPPPPLSDIDELLIAAVTAVLAIVLARGHGGLGRASAVGVLFVASGIYGKEIGDRVVRDGASAAIPLLLTPGLWLLVIFGIWAIIIVQTAFARSNAATVAAVTTTISSNGLIAAAAVLYRTPLVRAGAAVPLVLGIVVSALGAILLVAGRGGSSPPV